MIAKIIEYSAKNKFIIFLLVFFLSAWGYWALKNTPLDAIPDLSDTQVIIYTEWPGRSPDLVEDQITYPITSTLLAAPKVQVVRGFSFLGSSFIYVIFEEGTDIYWARSRILEYIQSVKGKIPADVNPVLGPGATRVGGGRRRNQDVVGRVLEWPGTGYMVRGRGYIKSLQDIENIAVSTSGIGTP